MKRKPWLKNDVDSRKNNQKRSIGGSLKLAYSWPELNPEFNIKRAVISGFGTGFLYGAVFILPLLATEVMNKNNAILFFSVGALFGFFMGIVCEKWIMGFMIERILTVLLGIALLGSLFFFSGV